MTAGDGLKSCWGSLSPAERLELLQLLSPGEKRQLDALLVPTVADLLRRIPLPVRVKMLEGLRDFQRRNGFAQNEPEDIVPVLGELGLPPGVPEQVAAVLQGGDWTGEPDPPRPWAATP